MQLSPQKGGNLTLTFHVSSADWDGQLSNNAASTSAVVSDSADIKITLSGPPSVRIGTVFVLNAQVDNKSAFAAASPSFTVTLPANVGYIEAVGDGWKCSLNVGVLSCGFASQLDAMSSAPSVTIMLQSGNTPAAIQFVGSVSSNTYDPDTSNNITDKNMNIDTHMKTFIPGVFR
jgi:hypothetical protein